MPQLQSDDLILSCQREESDDLDVDLGLALAGLYRYRKFEELEGINITIKYLRKLHDCPLEASNVPQHTVTTSLVEMLAVRLKGEAGDTLEDINEILLFCRRLISGASPDYLVSALQALTRAVLDAYSRGKQIQPLDQAIGCLREALKTRSPGFHRLSFDLANLLAVRFLVHHYDNDYEEANVLLDSVANSLPPGDPTCSCRFETPTLIAALGHAWSILNLNLELEDSERVLSRCRSFLDHSDLFGRPLHPVISELLASHVEQISKEHTPSQDTQATHSETDFLPSSTQLDIFVDGFDGRNIVPAPLPTSLEEEIDRHRGLYSEAGLMTECQRKYLQDLVNHLNNKIFWTQDTTSLEEAIQYNRRLMLLDTLHPTEESNITHVSNFGILLYVAFDRTKRVEPVDSVKLLRYLNKSIDLFSELLQLDNAQLTDRKFPIVKWLIKSLSTRFEWQRSIGNTGSHDLDELMVQFASGVEDTYATVPSRFELACQWANTAQDFGHHSLPAAYKATMSLMQRSLAFAPTLPIQHDRLVEMRSLYEKVPLNYASHYVCSGQLERAVETLEQGRSLLWSEMRGLRTSTDKLRAADSVLAERFTAINQKLEVILTTPSFSNGRVGMNDGKCEGSEWITQLPGLTEKQLELLKERDALISTIRGLPGMDDFLLPLPFDTLRSAASHGPVIIINHCERRSDILIVLHGIPPSHVPPTEPDFFDRAKRLKDELINAREKYGLDSEHYENALSFVLMELYELVGRPVVKRLNELGIAQQSRVWWCPTSDFWDLPLHAMGPIPSDDGGARYFSDIYISSYTPTLSALIASRSPRPGPPGTQTSARPTLLVAEPSQSPPGAWPDTLAERLGGPDVQTTSLQITSGNITSDTVLDGLQRHQLAHVAYHGKLETARPFDAALLLCNTECLTLFDIVRSRIPDGEFAFLPGSHTAESTDESIADEALHFSTAVQYSGFRSVIGTMWKVDDEDGQNLAKIVYRSMFSKKEGVEPYFESAKALQYALQQIRPGLPLARWVSHVHYGA